MTATDVINEPGVGDVLVGRYRLEKELGRGGFGIVFRATHIDTRRTVAIKVLLATHANKDNKAVERFRREAILSASLEYPNTVDVFDYGETEHGIFFLAMEYVRGTSLAEVIDLEAPFTPHRAVHITRQILYALMEAHAQDIVHRDVKPENIMIVPLMYDANFIKVMDFGIAKMVGGGGPQITQAGQTFGTPRYMSPEQLQIGEATQSTDLYALGLIVYEMFTGRPFYESDNLARTITDVIHGPPIAIPEDTTAPDPFRKLVAKACSRAPEDRFQTAQEFMEALHAWSGPSPAILAGMAEGEAINLNEWAERDSPTLTLGQSGIVERLSGIGGELAPEADTIPPMPPITAAEIDAMEEDYDPQRTSLVPTHADRNKPAEPTQMVTRDQVEAIEEAPPEPVKAAPAPEPDNTGSNVKTGCLVLLSLLVLSLSVIVVVLLLVVMDIVKF